MQRQQLTEYLEQLNHAIGDLNAPDDDKSRLTSLIAEIELQLNTPLQVTGDAQTLVDQVENMITTFEQDHPRVAGILNNIMLTLSNMGVQGDAGSCGLGGLDGLNGLRCFKWGKWIKWGK